MDFSDKIARYEEIERRGLLSQLPQEKQDMWAEYKRRQAKDSAVNNDAENNGKQSYLEQMAGKVATLDRGLTFGLGRKALGLTWAAGSKLGDVIVGNDNAPDFWGRYHEFVDPVVEAQQKYAEEHPAEALTAEIATGIANPVNKLGAGFIGKGKSLADVTARASAVGGGVGGVAGAMNTEYAKDLFPNTAAGVGVGAAMGGILPVAANRAGAVYNAIKRIATPEASVAGKATGLGNIVKDNESVRALSRGIMADDAVAAQVLQEAPTEMGRLNDELTDILNKTTGRKLNIEGAKQNADEAYKSYVAANADYPVYNTQSEATIPSEDNVFELLVNNRAYNRVKNKETADKGRSLVSFIVKRGGIKDVGGDLKAMDAGKQRIGIINNKSGESADDVALAAWEYGYFPEKSERPSIQDLKDAIDDEFFGKKRFPYSDGNKSSLIERTDALAQEMDMLGVNYSNMTAKEAENAYNNAVVEWSGQQTGVNPFKENTSRKLGAPNLKDVIGQLNEFKQNAMNKALAEGAAMSDYGAGSLDAVHKAQGVLNDMIENSFDKSVLGVKRPTTQTAELMGLKQVFTNMLEPSGVKSLDARIAKAKSLEYFYDMGYKFKPSEKKFEDLGIKTLRDKRAFLQGRLQSILDNVKDDKNLAKAIRADENTLKKLMPAKRFDELLRETSEIDRQYTRLNKYIQLANRELDKPLAADRPMSERGESKLSYLGSLYDKANALMWQNANRRRAQALLNGGAQNPEVLAALERLAGRYNLGQITPYIAQLAAQNQ